MRRLQIFVIAILGLNVMNAQQDWCNVSNTVSATATERDFNQLVKDYKNQGGDQNRELKVIPTVIHVVYRNLADSISMPHSRIEDQIDAANLAMRAKNPDTAQVRQQFKTAIADCNIGVCLAQKLPDSSSFSGVQFHYDPSFELSKYDSLQSATIIDPEHYLNVWVLPGRGGGGSIMPWQRDSTKDGFYVGAHWFGTSGGNLSDFMDEGTTFAHELAHYLGVYHTFHDGFQYLSQCQYAGSDTIGDWCGDTPLDWDMPFAAEQCDAGVRRCGDGDTLIAQTENFMYYNQDSCTYMFSKDQRSRMRACLDSLRPALVSSENLQRTGANCQLLTVPGNYGSVEMELQLMPVPANEYLRVRINDASGELISKLAIYSLRGRKVLQRDKVSAKDYRLSVKQYTPGVYIVQARVGEQVLTRKFTIR